MLEDRPLDQLDDPALRKRCISCGFLTQRTLCDTVAQHPVHDPGFIPSFAEAPIHARISGSLYFLTLDKQNHYAEPACFVNAAPLASECRAHGHAYPKGALDAACLDTNPT